MKSTQRNKQICNAWGKDFYKLPQWRALREKAFILLGDKCQCCGKTEKTSGKPLHVDHIKPRSKFPEFALHITNVQILCYKCNSAKSNTEYTDYRTNNQRILVEQYIKDKTILSSIVQQRRISALSDKEKQNRLDNIKRSQALKLEKQSISKKARKTKQRLDNKTISALTQLLNNMRNDPTKIKQFVDDYPHYYDFVAKHPNFSHLV